MVEIIRYSENQLLDLHLQANKGLSADCAQELLRHITDLYERMDNAEESGKEAGRAEAEERAKDMVNGVKEAYGAMGKSIEDTIREYENTPYPG
jgi:hypothetical protein